MLGLNLQILLVIESYLHILFTDITNSLLIEQIECKSTKNYRNIKKKLYLCTQKSKKQQE